MRAMLLEAPGRPLRPADIPRPVCGAGQLRLRVRACGVCRTDLHLRDGELAPGKLPLVLGHEAVGEIAELGPGVAGFALGERVGVPWVGWTCGACRQCRRRRENLCERARFTGKDLDGGFAEELVVDARHCFRLPPACGDAEAAPLLCAGLIGWRALRLAGDAERLGLYGFGAAAHLVAQVARFQGRKVFAFTRPGDGDGQRFALGLGAEWAGGSDERPPTPLDGAIVFAPAGELVPRALEAVGPGGTVVCGGIHMSAIPSFPYDRLWPERSIQSVANLERRDGEEFLSVAAAAGVRAEVTPFPLDQAEEALSALREGRFHGAAVLLASES